MRARLKCKVKPSLAVNIFVFFEDLLKTTSTIEGEEEEQHLKKNTHTDTTKIPHAPPRTIESIRTIRNE